MTTTSHNAYEWSRPVGLGESYGPMTHGKSKYEIILLRLTWEVRVWNHPSSMCMVTGVLWVICVHWDCVGTIWALADALRACVGPIRIFESPYVAHRPMSRMRPNRPRTTVYEPSVSQNHRKPVSGSCASSTFSYTLCGTHTGLKVFQKPCEPARQVVGLSIGVQFFYPYGAR